jgi:hypothetical protein
MNEPVLSREEIARDADLAAAFFVAGGKKPRNPFDEHVRPEAHAAWKAAFERYLLAHSVPDDCERSA